MPEDKQFNFKISLSVLDHLGRNLYRSFVTVLGEAISNSWDADAENVWIYVDREHNSFYIKDDGCGMDAEDFSNKFLKIGYSKRKDGGVKSPKYGRSYIGRKGIGKLALLSCAEKITVISKKEGGIYIGGTIDNQGLDTAITDDLTPQEYPLEKWEESSFGKLLEGHRCGTIIHFENLKDGIKNSISFLQKIVALYFRFSLLDGSFNIHINDELVTLDHLKELVEKTEFVWNINNISDPFVEIIQKRIQNNPKFKGREDQHSLLIEANVSGFIASVEKPRFLKIISTEERVGVDLFVNGRLRERDILKHIPTARVAESYLYGQLHFNDLDDAFDRFTSSREGIVADDPKYKEFLERLRSALLTVVNEWDELRRKYRKDGDPDNDSIPIKERKSQELFNVVAEEYELSEEASPKQRDLLDSWISALAEDARYNFSSYADCFVSENIIRNYIAEKGIPLGADEQSEVQKWKSIEADGKRTGGLSIDIRKDASDISYLDMGKLARLADKPVNGDSTVGILPTDAKQYKPIRDALAHTSRLTDDAKRRMSTVYDNIRARIKNLLS